MFSCPLHLQTFPGKTKASFSLFFVASCVLFIENMISSMFLYGICDSKFLNLLLKNKTKSWSAYISIVAFPNQINLFIYFYFFISVQLCCLHFPPLLSNQINLHSLNFPVIHTLCIFMYGNQRKIKVLLF